MIDLSLARWIGSYMRPYRGRLAALAVLSIVEVGVGVLTPWPLALVVDNVLGRHPWPGVLNRWLPSIDGHSAALLLGVVLFGGLVVQIADQIISTFHTQVQVETGQRMVYDLRSRLFAHLQALDM